MRAWFKKSGLWAIADGNFCQAEYQRHSLIGLIPVSSLALYPIFLPALHWLPKAIENTDATENTSVSAEKFSFAFTSSEEDVEK